MLFLLVHGNLCITVSVYGVNSWSVLLTPFPAWLDTCVWELGDMAAKAGTSLPANGTVCRTDL